MDITNDFQSAGVLKWTMTWKTGLLGLYRGNYQHYGPRFFVQFWYRVLQINPNMGPDDQNSLIYIHIVYGVRFFKLTPVSNELVNLQKKGLRL